MTSPLIHQFELIIEKADVHHASQYFQNDCKLYEMYQ